MAKIFSQRPLLWFRNVYREPGLGSLKLNTQVPGVGFIPHILEHKNLDSENNWMRNVLFILMFFRHAAGDSNLCSVRVHNVLPSRSAPPWIRSPSGLCQGNTKYCTNTLGMSMIREKYTHGHEKAHSQNRRFSAPSRPFSLIDYTTTWGKLYCTY